MEGMNRLEGDRIEYNYRTNLGVITNGRATLDSGVSFSGVEIRREGERQYSVRDGRFTAAALPARAGDPGLGVSVRRGDRVPGRMDHLARHLALGQGHPRPVLPRPRAAHRSAADGVSHSASRLRQPRRLQDQAALLLGHLPLAGCHLTPIYRTKRGFEIDGEYRYVLDERSRGGLTRALLSRSRVRAARPRIAARRDWIHDQVLTPTWTLQGGCQLPERPDGQSGLRREPRWRSARSATVDSNVFVDPDDLTVHASPGWWRSTEDLSESVDELAVVAPPGGAISSGSPPHSSALPLVAEGNTSAVLFRAEPTTTSTGRFDLLSRRSTSRSRCSPG